MRMPKTAEMLQYGGLCHHAQSRTGFGPTSGGSYQAHLKEIEDNVPEQLRSYYNSCALRMSIALSSFGKDLKNEAGAELIGDKANANALGGKTHVIIRARDMAAYEQKLLGDPDYADGQDTGYCSPQPGDIIVFAERVTQECVRETTSPLKFPDWPHLVNQPGDIERR